MKGNIITYAEGITKREIVDNNNTIFGKVIKSHQTGKFTYYYYPGILHEVRYSKLANGCYFIPESAAIHLIAQQCTNIQIINAQIFIGQEKLFTASEHFRNKFENRTVVNLE